MNFDDFEVGRYYWKGTEEGVEHYTMGYVVRKANVDGKPELLFADMLYGSKQKPAVHTSRIPEDIFHFFIHKHMIPINEAPYKVRHLTIKTIFGKGVIK